MKCSERIIELMHEYLDGEIAPDNDSELQAHLKSCPDCKTYFLDLKKVDAHIKETVSVKAPNHFTANVMASLPPIQTKKTKRFSNWFKYHPFLTAASVFILLMTGSLVSDWQNDKQFSVTKQENLVVQHNKVIVPEGEVVKGDIIVENGDLTIEGQVDGDVTVINGEHYLASAGHVTGEIEEVDKVFEWLWFKIKDSSAKVVSIFNDN
ncbi:anti-sigma factor family protein [Bacillus marasmi]|uniref:anti-sigma factor family protein n=1 Tax=Bacillus marasmi TaxID=1926279 RepID=UPI0011C94CA4|nr:anti-sigma factor [Bacillus marasmi]